MITRRSLRTLVDIYEYYILMLNLRYFPADRLAYLSGSQLIELSSETIIYPGTFLDILFLTGGLDLDRLYSHPYMFSDAITSVSLSQIENSWNIHTFPGTDTDSEESEEYLEYSENTKPFLDDEYVSDEHKDIIRNNIRTLYLEYIQFIDTGYNIFPELFVNKSNIRVPKIKNTCNICLLDTAYISCGRQNCNFYYCPECFVNGTCITAMCCGCRNPISPEKINIDYVYKTSRKRNYFKKNKRKRR